MYHNNNLNNFENFIKEHIALNFKSETPDMANFIDLVGVPKEYHQEFLMILDKYLIPYQVLRRGATVEIKYLSQYNRNDALSKRNHQAFENEISKIPHELLPGSTSVTYSNMHEFEDVDLGKRRSIFFVDTNEEEHVRSIAKHVISLDVHFSRINIENEDFEIKDLSWFVVPNDMKTGDHPGYELLCVLLDSGINHFILYDAHGTINIDIRIKTRNDNRKSNTKFRDDLKQVFRSSWEANFARVLNYLEQEWVYEKEFFHSEFGAYLPDFWIDKKILLEIKGFWNAESRNKVFWFKTNIPDYKLFIIDGDLYYDIWKVYKDIIPEWEDDKAIIKKEIVPVVGINIPARKKFVAKIKNGDQVVLIRDADNGFDKNAIKVLDINHNQLGFIAKDWAAVYSDKMDLGIKYISIVKEKHENVLDVELVRENIDETILYPFLRPETRAIK